jgi:ribosomal protein S18 acetylase RimI-like enzyme
MIRKATLIDIDSILDIVKDCAKYMIKKGIYQWNEFYPNSEVFKTDVFRNELYVYELDEEIVGCIVISEIIDEEYKPVTWLTDSCKNLYVHRLAVSPDKQGQGIAQQLMTFAENLGRENSYSSIRLDTFSQNERNQKFYEVRGYSRLENVYFPEQSDHPFYCYELIL